MVCRLGIGDVPFQVEIEIPHEKFSLINDSLADKPAQIRESYRTLHKVPVCIDLLKEKLIGIVGGKEKAGAYPVLYALAMQLAAQNCYTDVKMAFVFQSHREKMHTVGNLQDGFLMYGHRIRKTVWLQAIKTKPARSFMSW